MAQQKHVIASIALSCILSACEDQPRKNIYVQPIYGEAGPREGIVIAPDAYNPTSQLPPPYAGEPARGQQLPGRSATPVVRRVEQGAASGLIRLRDPVTVGPGGSISMNFDRIAIGEFARAVFGETLRLRYTIAPDVSGTVSLQLSDPVPRDAAYRIAVTALETIGISVRRDGDLVIIENDTRPAELGPRPNSVAFRKLNYVEAGPLIEALQPFTAPDAQVRAGAGPNMLVLSGSTAGVRALYDIIDAFDIDPLAGKAFGLFPLTRADAASVAAELRAILDTGGSRGIRIIELQRINAVVVVAESNRAIRQAGEWIRELDATVVPGRQVFIYQVQNRRAAELAGILQQGFGGGSSGRGPAPGAPSRPVAPALTPVAVTSADGETPAEAPAAPIDPALPVAPSFTAGLVVADTGTNSLVVTATPEEYELISSALRRLDVQPVQVLIEATILEVRLTDALRYGVRWFFESGNFSLNFSDVASLAAPAVSPAFNFVFDSGGARAVVSALDEVSDVEIVSSPSLMVLDNETARLNVGDQIGVPTRQSESVTNPDAPIVQEITRVNTGVILNITPRVNASGLVLLDVVQEVSEVAPGSTLDNPTISQRVIESSVLLRDRETLALGGLIRSRNSDGKAGIPILSDIPVVGSVFGSTDLSSDRTELLVIIRPIVVRNHNEARSALAELRTKLPGLRKLTRAPTE